MLPLCRRGRIESTTADAASQDPAATSCLHFLAASFTVFRNQKSFRNKPTPSRKQHFRYQPRNTGEVPEARTIPEFRGEIQSAFEVHELSFNRLSARFAWSWIAISNFRIDCIDPYCRSRALQFVDSDAQLSFLVSFQFPRLWMTEVQ